MESRADAERYHRYNERDPEMDDGGCRTHQKPTDATLRLGAPLFCKPTSQLFNLSLATSTVPTQWKQASIRAVTKVPSPLLQARDWLP